MTEEPRPSVDGPTAMAPSNGNLSGGSPEEPTVPDEALAGYGPSSYGPVGQPTPSVDEPTVASTVDEPTVARPVGTHFAVDGPTVAEPVFVGDEDRTRANDDPTTTGPTIASWPLDQFEPPPPGELIWQPDSAPVVAPPAGRRPAYYLGLGAAVFLVVALVAVAALVTVKRPVTVVAGTGTAAVPVVTSSNQPPPATSTTAPSSEAPANPYGELAAHPLSTATTRMPDATCALPRFDLPDDRQTAFFQAAKVCADDAWRPVLQAAKLDDAQVQVVIVTGAVQTPSCGDLAPTSPPTECEGTVYLAPAYLRDTERLGRYPGKYFGIFLREYARAIQFGTGLEQAANNVPNGSAADIDTRMDQQATCLAGMTSGALAGRGAVDTNITNEIRERLTTVDAPPDAQTLLDKGFQQRTPAACDTWQN